jgi:flagellar basal-body rod protein FlgB
MAMKGHAAKGWAMEPIQLFQVASKQAQYLTFRESVIAGNVANANTPGFTSKDVEPFSDVLEQTTASSNLNMVSTNPAHFGVTGGGESAAESVTDMEIKSSDSKNQVGLADEMMKSTEVRQQYDLNTALVKTLNRMMLNVVRR